MDAECIDIDMGYPDGGTTGKRGCCHSATMAGIAGFCPKIMLGFFPLFGLMYYSQTKDIQGLTLTKAIANMFDIWIELSRNRIANN